MRCEVGTPLSHLLGLLVCVEQERRDWMYIALFEQLLLTYYEGRGLYNKTFLLTISACAYELTYNGKLDLLVVLA